MATDNITGTRYNKLVAVSYSHTKEYPRKERAGVRKVPYWNFLCDCGRAVELSLDSVKAGGSKSCGCWRKEASRINNTTHGHASRGEQTRLYRIWAQMKRRCDLPTVEAYDNYGGRGIHVCTEWSDSFEVFEQWALTNGYRNDLTIDRRDNDGHYEPDNCRWTTKKVQANNKRNNRTVLHGGTIMTIAELSDKYKLGSSTIINRLDAGYTVDEAVGLDRWVRR